MKSLLDNQKILCRTCLSWVQCGKDKTQGFCLCKKLFTYTYETKCEDYFEDDSLSSEKN